MSEAGERVIVITGSSSGIGHALACRLSSSSLSTYPKRVQVVATMRDPEQCPRSSLNALRQSGCDVYALDLTDDASVESACQYVERKYGHCDAVVTAAGTGVAGNLESVSLEDGKQVFDVNVWGVMRVARAFAPLLRRRRCRLRNQDHVDSNDHSTNDAVDAVDNAIDEGTKLEKYAVFLAVSSQSGVCGLPYNDLYAASKHALEGMLESWRYTANVRADRDQCRYLHIAVVNPGATRTAYGERLVSRAKDGGHVSDGAWAWAEEVRRRVSKGQPADECACVIEDVMEQAFCRHSDVGLSGDLSECISFRNPTSAQSKRVVDAVLRDPAGSCAVYAERFALGRELDRRVRDCEVASSECKDRDSGYSDET